MVTQVTGKVRNGLIREGTLHLACENGETDVERGDKPEVTFR